MAEGEDPRLKTTKAMIRSVVMSVKEGVPASRFIKDYMEFTGEPVPYKSLGFPSLDALMKAIPDAILVRTVQGVVTYFAVADKATQHLQNLIQRQKSNPKKSKGLKKGPSPRAPKYHSQISKFSYNRGPGGGNRLPPPSFRTPASKVKGFTRQRPAFTTPARVSSPILATPTSFTDLSPLTVTIRNQSGERTDRVIERRAWDGGTGRKMAMKALGEVMGQRQAERKPRGYEMPPRFQRLQNNGGGANVPSDACDKPVAVVQPSQKNASEDNSAIIISNDDSLPDNIKSWTAKKLSEYPSGLWSSRLLVLYKENFGQGPPLSFIDTLRTWTNIAHVEHNQAANRYILYPVTDKAKESGGDNHSGQRGGESVSSVSPSSSTPSPISPGSNNSMSPVSPLTSPEVSSSASAQWQNYNVPSAILFEEDETTEVYASFSKDLGEFYLQRIDCMVEDITDMISKLQEGLVKPVVEDLQAGVYCAALYSIDECWYRARVLYLVSPTEVSVLFVDYGNVETVPLSNIRCLTEDTANIPAQAVCCSMFALKPFDSETGWSEKAKTSFASKMSDTELSAHTSQITDGVCIVELWAKDNDTSINEQLYNEGLVETYLPKNIDPPDLDLPQDGYVDVVVAFVDLDHCWLRLIGKEYSERLESFEDSLVSLYTEGAVQTRRLQTDTVCIVHCDLLYHRVKITDIQHHQANCFFLDHGYTEWFPLDQLVPLDKDVNQSLPYQAVWCVLVGLDKFMANPVTITELVERSKNKICVAEVIYRDPLKVILYDTSGSDDININEEIANKLNADGHSIDMSLFSPMSDNASESSRASSPPTVETTPQTVPDVLNQNSNNATNLNVEDLQSCTQNLTLHDPSVIGDNVNKDDSNPKSKAVISQNSLSVGGSVSTSQTEVMVSPSTAVNSSVHVSQNSSKEVVSASVLASQTGSKVEPSTTVNPLSDASQNSTSKEVVSASISASQTGPKVAPSTTVNPFSDSLCVAYDTWPLPPHVILPKEGTFFAVFVQSVFNPSNFVIVPYNVLTNLDDMMLKMNTRCNPALAKEGEGVTTTVVPKLQSNHLYMVVHQGVYYRAVYLDTKQTWHHVLLPDYCQHVLVEPEDIFFLPKPFWSTPFLAFRACLHGVRPEAGQSEKLWTESVKYKFQQLTLSKTLQAVIKTTIHADKGEGAGPDEPALPTSNQKLSLHLVNTSDPDTDVIIAEVLLATSGVSADV